MRVQQRRTALPLMIQVLRDLFTAAAATRHYAGQYNYSSPAAAHRSLGGAARQPPSVLLHISLRDC